MAVLAAPHPRRHASLVVEELAHHGHLRPNVWGGVEKIDVPLTVAEAQARGEHLFPLGACRRARASVLAGTAVASSAAQGPEGAPSHPATQTSRTLAREHRYLDHPLPRGAR